jgi:hypothetical protein
VGCFIGTIALIAWLTIRGLAQTAMPSTKWSKAEAWPEADDPLNAMRPDAVIFTSERGDAGGNRKKNFNRDFGIFRGGRGPNFYAAKLPLAHRVVGDR